MRLIDVDALIEKFGDWYVDECTESGFIGTLKDILATEPTIQPGKEQLSCGGTTDGTTSDLISRQAAIDALNKQIQQCRKALGSLSLSDVDKHAVEVKMASLRAYRKMLENLPTIEPEQPIIKCKDCKWWRKQKDSAQGRCRLLGIYPTGAWYCGNAERRNDGQG